MDFRVEVTERAFDEMDAIADYIRQRGSFESAEKWIREINHSLTALRYLAGIHPVVAESREVGETFHVLLHGPKNRRYKIFYLLGARHRVVNVVHVRHWARKNPTAAELGEFTSN
jgi:plasmid stabilization system protein ParE